MANGRIIGLTGHRGFVGSRLLPSLLNDGYEVAVFDGDLLDSKHITQFLDRNPELFALVHLAGSFFGTDNEVVDKNAIASLNLANCLRGRSGLRVIIASSGAVYGNSGDRPVAESHGLAPNTLYGLAKKWAEESFSFYLDDPNDVLVTLRLPSVYGPGNDKGVIHSWSESVRQSSSICLHGDGTQARSFLHVDDLIVGIGKFLRSSHAGVYNFAEQEALTLGQLVAAFQEASSVTVTNSPEQNKLETMILDSRKLYETLAWKPVHSVKAYISNQGC